MAVGVAAANTDLQSVLLAGVSGLTAGAISMAAGEYVSVSAQADAETAYRKRESQELCANPEGERDELTQIYVQRGLDEQLAWQVAVKLDVKDVLKRHRREERGITEELTAKPLQAAFASAISFSIGVILPLAVRILVTRNPVIPSLAAAALVSLACLGGTVCVCWGSSDLSELRASFVLGCCGDGGHNYHWLAVRRCGMNSDAVH